MHQHPQQPMRSNCEWITKQLPASYFTPITQPHCNISISTLSCCYSNQESIPKHRSSPHFHLRARQIRETMATTFASAAVAIPSFTGLKAETSKVVFAKQCSSGSAGAVKAGAIKASLKDVSVAAAAAAASLVLASNAMAIDVKLGSDDGGLVFEPREFSVPAGEKITFKNNTGFPHNVVFDEDEVPDGVDAGGISMPEDALLNGPGETFDVTLLTKGVYSFYCAPHQGAGMVGKVVVN